MRGDLVDFGCFVLVLVKLRLEHLYLAVFLLDHFLLPLHIILRICKLLRLVLRHFQLIKQSLLILLTSHQADMKIIFLFAFLIQNVFLFVKGFLKTGLVLFKTILVFLRNYILILIMHLL